jgi:hypothetical protein
MSEELPSKQAMAMACSAGLGGKPGIAAAAAVVAAARGRAGMAREVDLDEAGEAARQEEGSLDWSTVQTCFRMAKERKRTGKEER